MLAVMGASGVHMQGEQALAGGDEEAVPFRAAEAEVAGGFGEFDVPDEFAFRIEDVDAVVAVARPAGAGPDVAFDVTTNAVGAAFAVCPR